MDKSELRQMVKNRLGALSPTEIVQKSEQVRVQLFSMPVFKRAKTVMFYASTKGEVHTPPMIVDAMNSGKTVLLPKMDGERSLTKILACKVSDFEELVPNKFGIPEPRGASVPIELIDVIIVPGLAFDEKCSRIGRGHGYFDKFLALADKKSTRFIALAFELQLFSQIPSEPHDVPMHAVVTEKRIIEAQQ
ncbi:5-formyltetrahydrofolate cyclo-ligase [Candidatus Micrarchaeota archaeon CG08_land_8_20_14_0_20_49_17]|nr:MAG: 5-formyltetrahydrofolate cyclo-ligase [Candidatus Micrarchaeota archaeon CG1_02_49_24]PIU09940.1 MAG: 5-formyltetrahydrofolate cyclo-ligase [Candidatus Micrarchaeota archaeon CG08_land_8_20_14_0_20_49_17]PIZ96256.1 MAG: 5-formyltetrahydrofolate cyclo-ligase [Candidatus Micrarchaeota archaeon CG_4_10_14_0_2_um_filter_49_7]HII53459.1 5-formyltetrahydrofolate cyclo-ligase [Candidatus Micrarchaeota archaeon]